jgi:hypothetical protein
MIRSFSATTREIDDAKTAIAEITSALDLDGKLLAHSLGIIACFSEFAETGVLAAICDALPFDCIGATTCLCASAGDADQIFLAITVLTSDDCVFQAAAIPIHDGYMESIASGMHNMLGAHAEKPKLLLSYLPLIHTVSGDNIIREIDKATGGIPLFGTMAVDHNIDYSTAQTIYKGNAYRDMAVLGAVYGNPTVSYEVASLEESKIRKQKAIITASDGNILLGVNGKTVLEYFEEIGLTQDELSRGLGIIPLVVDHNDGTKPVARAVFALTPEGHAVCGGVMPEGATMAIGRIDMNDVLRTAGGALRPFVDGNSAILSYSCMARYLALGANSTAEADTLIKIAGDASFLLACSGGEVCPLPDENGKLKNFFHNFSIVFCKLS